MNDPKTMTFRSILREEFAQRRSKNPAYSQSAFARDIGLSVSLFSEVLKGKHGISRKSALTICSRLGYSKEQQHRFCDLVDTEHARSKCARAAAKMRIERHNMENEPSQLDMDTFAMIADGVHLALLELTVLKSFQNDSAWIAKRLGVSKIEVEVAIERLIRLGFLKRKGNTLISLTPRTQSGTNIPSAAIKQFHSGYLKKAEKALYQQDVTQREFATVVMSVDRDRVSELKAHLVELRKEFCNEVYLNHRKNTIYCLGIQFYEIMED